MTRCAGVVLAGGAGRRFGGPKAWAHDPDGWWLAEAVAALRPWCDGDVSVVTRADVGAPDVGQRATLLDGPGDVGPLGGIRRALARTTAPRLLVLPVDLAAPSSALAAIARHPAAGAVAARVGGRPHPLVCRLPTGRASRAAAALTFAGERRAGRLHELLGGVAVELPAGCVDRNERASAPGASVAGPRGQRGRTAAMTL